MRSGGSVWNNPTAAVKVGAATLECARSRLAELEEERARQAKRESFGLGGMKLPEDFECPITFDKMRDPVVASDGNTYERAAIEAVLATGNGLSPMTREIPPHGQSIPRLWGRAGMTTSIKLVTQPLHIGPWLTRARLPVLAGDSPRSLSSRLGPREHSDACVGARPIIASLWGAGHTDRSSGPALPPQPA